jgi:hypothetical protein
MRNRRGPRPAGEPQARERALPLAVRATTAASPERAAAPAQRRPALHAVTSYSRSRAILSATSSSRVVDEPSASRGRDAARRNATQRDVDPASSLSRTSPRPTLEAGSRR